MESDLKPLVATGDPAVSNLEYTTSLCVVNAAGPALGGICRFKGKNMFCISLVADVQQILLFDNIEQVCVTIPGGVIGYVVTKIRVHSRKAIYHRHNRNRSRLKQKHHRPSLRRERHFLDPQVFHRQRMRPLEFGHDLHQ